MRGRLICPLIAEIARIDTTATAEAGGYDPVFRTPRLSYPGGVRTKATLYMDPVRVPAQVGTDAWEDQRQQPAGNAPGSRLMLVMHYRDLERLGLVDATTREALFRVDDRLLQLYERRSGRPTDHVRPEAGGLYAVQVSPAGQGLGGCRNLLVVTFQERAQGLTTAPG